jgi:hypothetical protein
MTQDTGFQRNPTLSINEVYGFFACSGGIVGATCSLGKSAAASRKTAGYWSGSVFVAGSVLRQV